MTPTQSHLKWAACLLGTHATVSQVVLMREFFLLFEGNNLSSGLFLGYWLCMVALGAQWGGTCKVFAPKRINTMLMLMALGPLLSLLLIAAAQRWGGQSQSILTMAMAGLSVMPPAFIGGITFSWLAGAYSVNGNKNPIGNAYIYEQLGSAAIGLMLYLWMLTSLDAFQTTTLFTVLAMGLYIATLPTNIIIKTKMGMALVFVAMALLCLPVYSIIRNWTFKLPNAKITQITDTPFGQIWRIDSLGTTLWYENGRPVALTNDNNSTCNLLCDSTQTSLFLTPGFPKSTNGTADVYTLNNSLAYVLNRPNAVAFLKSTTNHYQCIVISYNWDGQSDGSPLLNEWLIALIASKLNHSGVLHITTNRTNLQQATLIAQKLNLFFDDVKTNPSHQLITCKRAKNNIPTIKYSDNAPWALPQRYPSMKQSATLALVMILGIGLLAAKVKRKSKIVLLTGISASALQVGLWHAMQTLSGFAYNFTGLAVVCFMATLSLGAFASQRMSAITPQNQTTMALVGLCIVVVAVTVASINSAGQNISGLWIMLPVAASGITTGYLFASVATSRPFNNRMLAGNLYAMDLVGGAIGAFAMGLVFIPVLGPLSGNIFALSASVAALAIAVFSPNAPLNH